MLAHFFPHGFGGGLQWNTAGFVLMSGYITGILLPIKPFSFAYGAGKFLKINVWILIYLSLVYITYACAGKADQAFANATLYMSVLEYIALFYLLVPFLGLVKHKKFVSLVIISIIIVIDYFIVRLDMSPGITVPGIINLLLIGGSNPYPHFPLLSFVNIGIIGFLFSVTEDSIPFKKPITIIIAILIGIISYLNETGVTSLGPSRHPPLFLYIVISLSIFSLILDVSRMLGKSLSNTFVLKLITDTARYSIVIFVIHSPVFTILNMLNIHQAVMIGTYLPDLVASVVLVVIFNIIFCYTINNTIGRLPPGIRRILL